MDPLAHANATRALSRASVRHRQSSSPSGLHVAARILGLPPSELAAGLTMRSAAVGLEAAASLAPPCSSEPPVNASVLPIARGDSQPLPSACHSSDDAAAAGAASDGGAALSAAWAAASSAFTHSTCPSSSAAALQRLGRLALCGPCTGYSADVTDRDAPGEDSALCWAARAPSAGAAACHAVASAGWSQLLKPLLRAACSGSAAGEAARPGAGSAMESKGARLGTASVECARLGALRLLSGLLARGALPAGELPQALPHLLRALARALPAGGWVLEPAEGLFYASGGALARAARGRCGGAPGGEPRAGALEDPPPEPSELLRCAALQLLRAVLACARARGSGALLGPYAGDIAGALHAASRDGAPRVAIAACALLRDVAGGGACAGEAPAGAEDEEEEDAGVTPFLRSYLAAGGLRGALGASPFEEEAPPAGCGACARRAGGAACAAGDCAAPPPPPGRPRAATALPALLAPAAAALVRSLACVTGGCGEASVAGSGLWHRSAGVRWAALGAAGALVACARRPGEAPQGGRRSGAGACALGALLGLGGGEAGSLPIAGFYGCGPPGRNALAALGAEASPRTRAAVAWLAAAACAGLREAPDWAPRLLPLLLSARGDGEARVAAAAADAAEGAARAWAAGLAGEPAAALLREVQGGQGAEEEGTRAGALAAAAAAPPPAPLGASGRRTRPGALSRAFVRVHAGFFLPALMAQAGDYAPALRGAHCGLGARERTAADSSHRAAVLLALTAQHLEAGLLRVGGGAPALLRTLLLAGAREPPGEEEQEPAAAAAAAAAVERRARDPRACAPDFSYAQWMLATARLLARWAPARAWRPLLEGLLREAREAAAGEGARAEEAAGRARAAERLMRVMTAEAQDVGWLPE